MSPAPAVGWVPFATATSTGQGVAREGVVARTRLAGPRRKRFGSSLAEKGQRRRRTAEAAHSRVTATSPSGRAIQTAALNEARRTRPPVPRGNEPGGTGSRPNAPETPTTSSPLKFVPGSGEAATSRRSWARAGRRCPPRKNGGTRTWRTETGRGIVGM